MRILKHGNTIYRKFICKTCGCEFVADPKEYRVMELDGLALWYEAECPECWNYTQHSEPWEYKDI